MFYDNLKAECERQGLKITPIVLECGGNKGSLSGWKKGAMPNSDIVMKLSVRLNIPTDVLLFGKEKAVSPIDVHNSNVGAIGNNSNGTVNIGNNNMTYGDNSSVNINNGYKEKVCYEQDETANEILRILNELPLRERSKLLTMIYDFEDEYISKNK